MNAMMLPELFDNLQLMLPGMIAFIVVAIVTIGIGSVVQARGAVRRRAGDLLAANAAGRPTSFLGIGSAQKALARVSRGVTVPDDKESRMLRQQLIQAGFFDQSAVVYFFLTRIVAAIAVFVLALAIVPMVMTKAEVNLWLIAIGAGCIGYFLPRVYLRRRIKAREAQHRVGFPDFLDLMVVCADAGLSMEAAIDRVGRELTPSYPSLGTNLGIVGLELRAGRRLGEALEHLGDRLGIDEARQFATLLQQSEELGSSLTDSLRVYGDDMRNKRLMRAEEKAYALPAKLSLPLIMCIFPVFMVVIILPVVVRFMFKQ